MLPSTAIDTAWASLTPTAVVAYSLLTLALAALWWPRFVVTRLQLPLWTLLFGAATVAALAAHLLQGAGLIAILVFGAACVGSRRAHTSSLLLALHAVVLLLAAGLLLHLVPGFDNPRVLTDVMLTADAAPYTKYLSFDKGTAGLFLLGLYVPDRTAQDPLTRRWPALLWRFIVLVMIVMAATRALGYAQWEPKLPAWWPQWVWSMIFLTALPEEAIFRGVVQHALAARLAGTRHGALVAAVIVGGVFGVAHAAGGWGYVLLATLAGVGYGWIYASTGSMAAAIAAHAGLNTLHFLLFTYPAVAAR